MYPRWYNLLIIVNRMNVFFNWPDLGQSCYTRQWQRSFFPKKQNFQGIQWIQEILKISEEWIWFNSKILSVSSWQVACWLLSQEITGSNTHFITTMFCKFCRFCRFFRIHLGETGIELLFPSVFCLSYSPHFHLCHY